MMLKVKIQAPITQQPSALVRVSTPAQETDKAKELPPHQPGAVRDFVEKTGGVIGAVTRVPGSFVSGLLVGGLHGRRRGADSDYQTDPLAAATGLVVCKAAQGLVTGMATAYMVLGPLGAAASLVKETAGSTFSTYMFIKGGSAGEMGRRVAADIDGSVDNGDGAVKGLFKGAWAGGISAAKGAAVTGYYEGRAATSGTLQGLSQVKTEFSEAQAPRGGGPLARTAKRVAAAVAAVISAPAGLAHGLLANRQEQSQELSTVKRLSIAAANGAVVGAAVGLLGGPVGAAVGGAVGAVLGLLSPAASKKFAQGIVQSMARAKAKDTDLGHDIANRRRDLVQSVIVGSAAGARQGWDAVAS